MITYGVSLGIGRPRARRRAPIALIRTAGMTAAVLALGGAAVPAASAQPARVAAGSAAWAVQPTPNPLVPQGQLTVVSCLSASACVAVGGRRSSAGPGVTLAEAWNGTAWTVQRTPSPQGASSSTLTGV